MKLNLRTRLNQTVGVIVLAILAVNAAVYYQIGVDASERPSLTAGLTSKDGADVNAIFLDRLLNAHSVGSNASAFTADLAGQGFKSSNWGIAAGQKGFAMHDDSNWFCRQGAEVRWTVNEGDQLATLTGAYQERGCLWSRRQCPSDHHSGIVRSREDLPQWRPR